MKRTLLLIGDSNAGGKQPAMPVPPITYPHAARIRSMPSSSTPFSTVPAVDPLIAGGFVGPGIACADEIIARSTDTSLEILIVARLAMNPISVSLTPYSPEYRDLTAGAMLARDNWGPVCGVLMVQGLHDAADFSNAFAWPIWARQLRSNLRVQLADNKIPFAVCGFAAKPAIGAFPYHDLMQLWISQLEFDDPRTLFLDCSSYTTNDPVFDPYHFTAASQVEIGRIAGADIAGIAELL